MTFGVVRHRDHNVTRHREPVGRGDPRFRHNGLLRRFAPRNDDAVRHRNRNNTCHREEDERPTWRSIFPRHCEP